MQYNRKGKGQVMTKYPIAFRLSDEAQRLLSRMGEQSGITKTAVVELAIRERAEREKIAMNERSIRPCHEGSGHRGGM